MLGLVTPCGEENAGAPHIMEKGLQPESPTLLSALCGNPTRTSVVQTELVADETAPVSIDFLGEEEPKRKPLAQSASRQVKMYSRVCGGRSASS